MAGIFFWIIMLLIVLFHGWWGFSNPANRPLVAGSLLVFVALGLLGWKVFGFAP